MDPIGRLVGLQLQIQEANISMKRANNKLLSKNSYNHLVRYRPISSNSMDLWRESWPV